MSLLHRAAQMGSIHTISKLLDAGVDIETRDSIGQTACHIAVQNGQLAVLRLLLDRGANIYARNVNGASLLCAALQYRRESITLFLLESGVKVDTNCSDVVSVASPAVLDRLLSVHAVDIGALRDRCGRTVLHHVALNSVLIDHLSIRLLFFVDTAHVDINATNIFGKTALFEVAYLGGLRCFDLLLALGTNVFLQDGNGRTICHEVAYHSNFAALCSCLAVGGIDLLD